MFLLYSYTMPWHEYEIPAKRLRKLLRNLKHIRLPNEYTEYSPRIGILRWLEDIAIDIKVRNQVSGYLSWFIKMLSNAPGFLPMEESDIKSYMVILKDYHFLRTHKHIKGEDSKLKNFRSIIELKQFVEDNEILDEERILRDGKAEIIYKNKSERLMIIKILHEDAATFWSASPWCLRDAGAWRNYTKSGSLFYYILDNKRKLKWALDFGQKIYWDIKNHKVSLGEVVNIYPILKELFSDEREIQEAASTKTQYEVNRRKGRKELMDWFLSKKYKLKQIYIYEDDVMDMVNHLGYDSLNYINDATFTPYLQQKLLNEYGMDLLLSEWTTYSDGVKFRDTVFEDYMLNIITENDINKLLRYYSDGRKHIIVDSPEAPHKPEVTVDMSIHINTRKALAIWKKLIDYNKEFLYYISGLDDNELKQLGLTEDDINKYSY